MQARRGAREISFIIFSQLGNDISEYKKENFEDMIIKSIRALMNSAQEDLKTSARSLIEMRDYFETLENDDKENLERPIGVSNLPVKIPLTSEMKDRVDRLTDVCEKSMAALEIAEMTVLYNKDEVKDYVINIIQTFQENEKFIKEKIKEFLIGWTIDRMVKMDKYILSIAVVELLFIKNIPAKVVIDEALELAKKYSTEDSPSFINGILAGIVREEEIIR